MILGISGYAQVGKDTVAGFTQERGLIPVAFADKLRESMLALDPIVGVVVDADDDGTVNTLQVHRYSEAMDQLGYEAAKTQIPEVRALLQRMGTEVGRNVLGGDVWVNALMDSLDPAKDYVITDMRFPNEWAAVRKASGSTVRIERPGVGPVNDHPSEVSLDGFSFDYVIVNNGTLDDLREKVEVLFQ